MLTLADCLRFDLDGGGGSWRARPLQSTWLETQIHHSKNTASFNDRGMDPIMGQFFN